MKQHRRKPCVLDLYVNDAVLFRFSRSYILSRAIRSVASSDFHCRILEGKTPEEKGNLAIIHVDLTEVPPAFLPEHTLYDICLNRHAVSIHRHRYATFRVRQNEAYDGPVVVKSVLNHRGVPEFNHRLRQGSGYFGVYLLRSILLRKKRNHACPSYLLYRSPDEVPKSVWCNPDFMVERYLPGKISPPVVKYRYDFFLDVSLHTRTVFGGAMGEPETLREVSLVGNLPDEISAARRQLNLDFGSLDYFIVDGKAVVVDANKTTTCTRDWRRSYPFVNAYVEQIGRRLIELSRNA